MASGRRPVQARRAQGAEDAGTANTGDTGESDCELAQARQGGHSGPTTDQTKWWQIKQMYDF